MRIIAKYYLQCVFSGCQLQCDFRLSLVQMTVFVADGLINIWRRGVDNQVMVPCIRPVSERRGDPHLTCQTELNQERTFQRLSVFNIYEVNSGIRNRWSLPSINGCGRKIQEKALK